MRNHIDIDLTHSRAIAQEIGERLRTSLSVEPELPDSLRIQIDRLRRWKANRRQLFPSELRIGGHGRAVRLSKTTENPFHSLALYFSGARSTIWVGLEL